MGDASPADGGSGYSVGDVVTVNDGDLTATLTVTSVDGNGGITNVDVTDGGLYSLAPAPSCGDGSDCVCGDGSFAATVMSCTDGVCTDGSPCTAATTDGTCADGGDCVGGVCGDGAICYVGPCVDGSSCVGGTCAGSGAACSDAGSSGSIPCSDGSTCTEGKCT